MPGTSRSKTGSMSPACSATTGLRVEFRSTRPTGSTNPPALMCWCFRRLRPDQHAAPYLEPLNACARVLNRKVTDISKRLISRYLVKSPEEHEGAVIVKSNLNFGGAPEARLLARRGGEFLRRIEATRRQPWVVSGLFGKEGYPIFANPASFRRARGTTRRWSSRNSCRKWRASIIAFASIFSSAIARSTAVDRHASAGQVEERHPPRDSRRRAVPAEVTDCATEPRLRIWQVRLCDPRRAERSSSTSAGRRPTTPGARPDPRAR